MDRLVWAGTSAVRVGRYHLGIRASSNELHALIRRALAGYLVDDDDVPPNYSVQIALAGAGPSGLDARPFHFLFRGGQREVRSRSARRVLEALFAQLGWYATRPSGSPSAPQTADPLGPPDARSGADEGAADAGLVAVDALALALVRGGEAVLLPWDLRPSLDSLERPLQRAGFAVVDAVPQLDAGARVVVAGPRLRVDASALAEVECVAPPPRRADPLVAPGRYPLRGWVFGQGVKLTPAGALAEAFDLVANLPEVGAARALDTLAGVFERSAAVRLEAWSRPAVLGVVGELWT